MNNFSIEFIENHFYTLWDFGNKILYSLCSDNPFHSDDSIIIAKVLFIGRIYAAAVERRRKGNGELVSGDNFYTETIVNTFRNSDFDDYIRKLQVSDENSISLHLEVHKKLVDMLVSITGLEKRSFASKYLHFHFENKFFIYDSRAVASIKKYVKGVPPKYRQFIDHQNTDVEYAKFFCKCLYLQDEIKSKYTKAPELITPRHIDNMLLR
jgi:hypothetical protein